MYQALKKSKVKSIYLHKIVNVDEKHNQNNEKQKHIKRISYWLLKTTTF